MAKRPPPSVPTELIAAPEPTPKPVTSASDLLGLGVEHLQTLLELVRAALAGGQELNGQVLRESAGVVRAIATAAAEQRQAQKLRDARKPVVLADVLDYARKLQRSERAQLIQTLTDMNTDRSVLG